MTKKSSEDLDLWQKLEVEICSDLSVNSFETFESLSSLSLIKMNS